MAQLVEQLIRNEQAVGSSPTISSKTCVNTALSQVFSFSEMNFKTQCATKNLTLLAKFPNMIQFDYITELNKVIKKMCFMI